MKLYYQWEVSKILEQLNSSTEGLSLEEAKNRLEKNGYNKIVTKKKTSNIKKFFNQFNNIMIIILMLSAIFSFIISIYENESFMDSIVIFAIVLLNAIMGYVQEKKADKSIEELDKLSSPKAKIRREGKIEIINAEEIVTGDILLLEAGDFIPADARIIKSFSLRVDESSLTGESIANEKTETVILKDTPLAEQNNTIFMGTNVVYGRGEAIVIATGEKTEFGKIANNLSQESTVLTPLQIKINEISKALSLVIAIIILLIAIISILKGKELIDIVLLSVSLAVAAIPEGLPTVITVVLSLGMKIMATKNAIIRKMSSVETLGSTDIICTDKTGTITQNKMKIKKSFFLNEKMDDLIFNCLALPNDVVKEDDYIGDETEIAIYKYLEEKINIEDRKEKYPRKNEIPFDSKRKMMTTVNEIKGELIAFSKGSLEAILTKSKYYYHDGKECLLTENIKKEFYQQEKNMTNEALRVLAFAYKKIDKEEKIEEELVIVGLLGMMDPPRDQVKESIELCYHSGIRPIMITGDSLQTAMAIAKEVGMVTDLNQGIEGAKLDQYSDEELKEVVKKYNVYARVSPEHKLRIVKAWQANQKVVAMTGDGVNDAPAIKLAHIGISMGITGTEVTKSASDVVLADDCFNTIVLAVKEGRRIFDNIRNAILYLLTGNFAEIIIILIGIIFNVDIFLPVHLLYINLVTDSIPAISLAFELEERGIMNRPVRSLNKPFFTPFMIARIAISSLFKSIVVLTLYFITFRLEGPEIATTMSFLALTIMELIFAFSSKNPKKSILNKNIFKNKYLNISAIVLTFMLIALFVTPLESIFMLTDLKNSQILLVLGMSCFVFLLDELFKPVIVKCFKD